MPYCRQKTIANYASRIDEAAKDRASIFCSRVIQAHMDNIQAHMDNMQVEFVAEISLAGSVVRHIEECDPTKSKMFVLTMLEWLIDGSMRSVEDAEGLEPYFLTYVKYRNRLKGVNLKKITMHEFIDRMEVFLRIERGDLINTPEGQKFLLNDAILYDEDDKYAVIQIRTHAAAVYFGQGTRWCTAVKKWPDTFDRYNNVGTLFIIFDKETHERVQLHFEDFQFMDERDMPISNGLLRDLAHRFFQYHIREVIADGEKSGKNTGSVALKVLLDTFTYSVEDFEVLDAMTRTSELSMSISLLDSSEPIVTKMMARHPRYWRALHCVMSEQESVNTILTSSPFGLYFIIKNFGSSTSNSEFWQRLVNTACERWPQAAQYALLGGFRWRWTFDIQCQDILRDLTHPSFDDLVEIYEPFCLLFESKFWARAKTIQYFKVHGHGANNAKSRKKLFETKVRETLKLCEHKNEKPPSFLDFSDFDVMRICGRGSGVLEKDSFNNDPAVNFA